MFNRKRSFFEKITGTMRVDDDMFNDLHNTEEEDASLNPLSPGAQKPNWIEETVEEGELTVDVYETGNDIVIKTMVAGVKPDDLDVSITREMVTIRGKREADRTISEDGYFHKELYWGTFSRTIVLPKEVDIDNAEAIEKHGLLIIKLPKLDKNKEARIKVKGT